MKTVAIVQARMGSTRLPGKVMQPICGTPMIGLLLGRLSASKKIDQILVATSGDPQNESLVAYVCSLGYSVFLGSEDDVLDRYYQAARAAKADTVVRVTGDCPLIDPAIVDEVIARFEDSGADYASNVSPPTYPDGLDTEVFSYLALETAWSNATAAGDREHVTPFLRESGRFTQVNLANTTDASQERWTVDRPEDMALVKRVFEHFHPRLDFDWREILALSKVHPGWFLPNQHFVRNERMSPNG